MAQLSFMERLKEIDRFFAGRSAVHRTLRRLVTRLAGAGIVHSICGGMAVNAHAHRQTSDDVDVLLTEEGLAEFRRRFANAYQATGLRRGRRYLDPVEGVPIDIVVTGHCPGLRTADAIVYPDPADATDVVDGIRYLSLVWLVRVKLAMRRHRDLGDVAALIRVHSLDESFLTNLPVSLHQTFLECLEEKRREDEYIAREG